MQALLFLMFVPILPTKKSPRNFRGDVEVFENAPQSGRTFSKCRTKGRIANKELAEKSN